MKWLNNGWISTEVVVFDDDGDERCTELTLIDGKCICGVADFKLRKGRTRIIIDGGARSFCIPESFEDFCIDFFKGEDLEVKEDSMLETNEKVKKLIEELQEIRDTQYSGPSHKDTNHMKADNILCSIISELGHPEVEGIFEDIDKWYS